MRRRVRGRQVNAVKKRIARWLTLLMGILAVVLLVYMHIVSESVADATLREQLMSVMRENARLVRLPDGHLTLDDGFRFFHDGVTTLVYGANETLLAGQVPVEFTVNETFLSGTVRTVTTENGSAYLMLDVWVPYSWDSGVWLRGITEAPDVSRWSFRMLTLMLITLPLFLLLAACGSYAIARRAFRPLDRINATAEAINGARDLSGRIGLPRGEDEFSRLGANFDGMFERLERSFEAEEQFTSDASHELRTPVSIIKGACEYAEKYSELESPQEQLENIEMIHRQADRMGRLITQLLHMTRMDQGTVGTDMVRLELGAAVSAMCEELFPDREGLTVAVARDVYVTADRELLARLLCNLVENGFKYNRADGKVHVAVTCEGGMARLSVTDDGIGIPADEQERIWERFYRADASRTDESGMGLGLSMVRQIARLHGGEMTLCSEVGVGSTFSLTLPTVK